MEKGRLRTDMEYLANRVCEEFRKYDTFRRGMITAAAFSRALDDLGLRYGQQEVDSIMQYCTITDDGYVHYKELYRKLAPGTPRAKQSQAGDAIFPPDDEGRDNSSVASSHQNGHPFQQETLKPYGDMRTEFSPMEIDTEKVRHLYARWDRGLLTDAEFKSELYYQLGIEGNDEVERLLSVYGPSRNLSFGKLMHALQIDDFTNRKCRNPTAFAMTQGGRSKPNSRGTSDGKPRNPVNWDDGQGSSQKEQVETRADRIHRVLCAFVDGVTPSVVFRAQLQQCSVAITEEIDRLIRKHESGNSTQYRDYARVIFRNEPHVARDNRSYQEMGDANIDMPYAHGGAFAQRDQGFEDTSPYNDRRHADVKAPYATESERMPPMPKEDFLRGLQRPPDPRQEAQKKEMKVFASGVRKDQDNGDIIAWRDEGSEAASTPVRAESEANAAPPVRQEDPSKITGMAPGWRTNGDIISWTTKDVTPSEKRPRFGKRYFGGQHYATPFGTDADMMYDGGSSAAGCPAEAAGYRRN